MALQHLADAIGEIRENQRSTDCVDRIMPMPSCLIDPFVEAYERCG
jgi:hypothetical protein